MKLLAVILAIACRGLASDLIFSWDANPDEVTGYRLNWTQEQSAAQSVDVGMVTSFVLEMLQPNKRYDFWATALNGPLESQPSNHVTGLLLDVDIESTEDWKTWRHVLGTSELVNSPQRIYRVKLQ